MLPTETGEDKGQRDRIILQSQQGRSLVNRDICVS